MNEATEKKVLKGLRVYIYKSEGKSYSNNGLSEHCDRATLVPSPDFPDVPQIFEVSDDAPAVAIVKRKLFGGQPAYLTAYPVDEDGNIDKGGRMAGGTFISACDSRFPADYPVPLHDRREW